MPAPTCIIDEDADPGAYAEALLHPPFAANTFADETWTNGFTPPALGARLSTAEPRGRGPGTSPTEGPAILDRSFHGDGNA